MVLKQLILLKYQLNQHAKEQATTDLNNAVDEAKKAIDQDSNLTDEEKQVAKDQIDSDAKQRWRYISTDTCCQCRHRNAVVGKSSSENNCNYQTN